MPLIVEVSGSTIGTTAAAGPVVVEVSGAGPVAGSVSVHTEATKCISLRPQQNPEADSPVARTGTGWSVFDGFWGLF